MRQTVTLQFGPTADKLGSYFWNGQYALLQWAECKKKTDLADHKMNFSFHGARATPRLVSILPKETKEIIGELDINNEELENVNVSSASGVRELFPHIELNKRTLQRADITMNDSYDPFYSGLVSQDHIEDIFDSIRFFAEECDSLGVIQAFASNDQFGGFGSRIMEQVADDFDKKTLLVFSVPSAELDSSWDSKALSLYSFSLCCHVPFALIKPSDLKWGLDNYEPLPILASSIDTIQSVDLSCALSNSEIGSIAFGMRMECDASADPVLPVMDLVSFSSPSFEEIICRSDRTVLPSYIRLKGHGYIPHHTSAAYGLPSELPDYLEDIAKFISNDSKLKHIDPDLHSEVVCFLNNQSDK
jgi:hypothetical protein